MQSRSPSKEVMHARFNCSGIVTVIVVVEMVVVVVSVVELVVVVIVVVSLR